jgi:hypothetical protein
MHSEGFAGADAISGASSSDHEVVQLTETSAVLDLLLQYMYRQPQPDLKKADFETLAGVAEAAEKYQVFAAISCCKLLMEAAAPKHPLTVLYYATRHGYTEIMDVAAKETIGIAADEVAAILPPMYLLVWYRYHQSWLKALQGAYLDSAKSISSHSHWSHRKGYTETPCNKWAISCAQIMQRLGANPESLKRLEYVFAENAGEACYKCSVQREEWQKIAERERDSVPVFSTYI